MGLIEKAFQAGAAHSLPDEASPKVQGADYRGLTGIDTGRNRDQAPAPLRQFDLSVHELSKNGFFIPSEKSSRLALELRMLKRRLLRRTGYLRAQAPGDIVNRRAGRQRNLIMVTSTRPAEGKTFTSINLALSLALEDEIPVLLVDADAPRPKVQAHLGINEPYGLSDLIRNPTWRPERVCAQVRGTSLTVLPEGSPVDHAAELFGSADGQRTFGALSQWRQDQLVILDAPPVLATTEAIVLGSIVDEIIFVVEADATPEPAIASAIEELLDVNPNISLVLNKTLIGAGGSHYGSYSDYYPRGARAAARGSA